jgi:hypothetical protein
VLRSGRGLSSNNRNIAIYDSLIIDTSVDDHVFALDTATGDMVWETEILNYDTDTAHAIEQVPEIERSLIESMLAVSPHVSCVHFEPVGFQLEAHSRHGEVGATREYADSVRHNTNLISTLQDAAKDGALEIMGIERDLYGHKVMNGLSVVSWSKVTEIG